MRRWTTLGLTLVLAALALSGCMFQDRVAPLTQEQSEYYVGRAQEFERLLFAADWESAYAMCSQTLQRQLTLDKLKDLWAQIRLMYGDPVQVDAHEGQLVNSYPTITAKVKHKHGGSAIQLTFDDKSKLLDGLWFGLYAVPFENLTPPEDVVEEPVTLNAGGDYPLEGLLTLPKDAVFPVPAVVLVHGSGASDRNESIGSCAPFADIAWGLARRGVATLRYDKRTYVYGPSFTAEQLNALTVKEETIEDALAAVELLAADSRIDPDALTLLGHSMGGMLAPRMASQSDKIKGIVSLAGSPRSLAQIVYDQNLALHPEGNDLKAVEKEWAKAQKLSSLKDSDTVFGMPAGYLKEMEQYPVEQLVKQLSLPILVLQGGRDIQVGRADYEAWQQALQGYSGQAEFHYYDELNHLFILNEDPSSRDTVHAYLQEGHVAKQVLDDMADWLHNLPKK